MVRSIVWSGQATIGLTLIGIGLVLLARNYLGVPIENWWALFILIPALASFWAAWAAWRASGSVWAASGPLTGGVVFLTLALIFLLDLEWRRIWPIFLLIIGAGALLPVFVRGRRQ